MKATLALALLAACGGAKPAPEPPTGRSPARPAPTGFAQADLVSFGDGVLSTYKLDGDRMVKLGELRLAPPAPTRDPDDYPAYDFPLIGDWADHDHLFVRTAKRQVVMVTAAGITDVVLPEPKALAFAHPEDASESDGYGGKQYTYVDLVVEDGEVWWSRCPYSFANDGGYCFKWVNAKLWPTTKLEVVESEREPRRFAWKDDPPKGYKLEPADDPRTCVPPTGASVPIPRRLEKPKEGEEEEDYYGEHLFHARWISANPPKLLATYGYSSEFEVSQVSKTALFDGCAAAPSWTVDDAPTPGPGGLWEADGHVFRGAKELGVAGSVRFRPSR